MNNEPTDLKGLSMRARNVIHNGYGSDEIAKLPISEAKERLFSDIVSGKFKPLNVRCCGRKTINEIKKWCETKKDEEMTTGALAVRVDKIRRLRDTNTKKIMEYQLYKDFLHYAAKNPNDFKLGIKASIITEI